MGNLSADGMAGLVADGNISLRVALHWHLTSNHFPPLPESMVGVAEAAIEHADEGEYEIELPAGVTYRGEKVITVDEAIESLHLGSFVAQDEEWED